MAQGLADNSIKTVVITVFFVKKNETKDIEKTQIKLLGIKTTICEIKDTLEI